MGILGSAFGRALAGAGEAGAKISNKYIDEDLAKQRAQAFADIQRTNAGLIRQDDLNFRTDPGNLDKSNTAARTTALAAGDTATEVETRRLSNPGLMEAGRVKLDTEARDARGRKTEELTDTVFNAAEKAKKDADTAAEITRKSTPEAIAAERAIARARHVDSVGAIAQAATEQFKLGAMKTVQTLREQLSTAEKTGDRAGADSLQSQIDALTDKGGKSAQFATVAEKAAGAMTPAMKILADPMAPEDAKEEARTTVRQQRAILETFAKRAGVDLSATTVDPYAPKPGEKPGKKDDKKAASAAPETPAWQPDPNSPVAKQRTLMEAARAATANAESQSKATAAAERASAQASAAPLIQARDKRALYQFQQSPEFSALDFGTQSKISVIVNGR